VAAGVWPGLLDHGEWHRVDVEADLARCDLPEQAVVGRRGVGEGADPPRPLPNSWTGAMRSVIAGRAAISPAVIPTWM
jgi:hypothetical protein